ncbi:hypothetical protein AtDm6_0174 [Acetobacter tropicalis]|uniref:Uncharacterized protein n=1 Tax=Acetobacter tropicalis TaxID=104102 RepID=A0A094ZWV4_9PROT|nr:hypothetical protein AtDm6_0174 [Acetobacter tropicalis]
MLSRGMMHGRTFLYAHVRRIKNGRTVLPHSGGGKGNAGVVLIKE